MVRTKRPARDANSPESACLGKHAYDTRAKAERALTRMKSRRRLRVHRPGDRKSLTAYRCRYCGSWHLGNT